MVTESLALWTAFILRLLVGALYAIRGYPKIISPERTATLFLKLKIPAPKLPAIIAALLEFFGGIALIIGFATRPVAALLIIETSILAWKKIVLRKKFASDYELDLVSLVILVLLLIFGAGNLSLDQTFGWLLG